MRPINHVNDERIIRRTPFGGKDGRAGRSIARVGTEPVYRLRGKHHKTARAKDAPGGLGLRYVEFQCIQRWSGHRKIIP